MSSSVLSTSCVSTVVTIGYLYMAGMNLYKLMNPLYGVDLSVFSPGQMVKPLWDDRKDRHQIMVFLSKHEKFSLDFLQADDGSLDDDSLDDNKVEPSKDVVLLWDEASSASSDGALTRQFVLTPKRRCDEDRRQCDNSDNVLLDVDTATKWFDPDDSSSLGSSSFLVAAYNAMASFLVGSENGESNTTNNNDHNDTRVVELDEKGPIWSALMKNRTVHVHVVLIQKSKHRLPPLSSGLNDRKKKLSKLAQNHQVLFGQVPLVKHDAPVPSKPKRILYHDLSYLVQRYVLGHDDFAPPWHFLVTQPLAFNQYTKALADKRNAVGVPYWKPEVAVRLVADSALYPVDVAGASGMDNVGSLSNSVKQHHPSGYAYLPPLHVDEMGLTSEKYVPLNGTVAAVPLKITFDTSEGSGETALSPQRYRLLRHMTNSLDAQRDSGLFEDSDVDDMRRLIADTNVMLLTITMLASVLHLLFEFLTFKSDVTFWKENTDLTGLSVRALFVDVVFQIVLLLYLIEMDSSILMTGPSAVGILIAMWKCRRSAGLEFVPKKMASYGQQQNQAPVAWYNHVFALFGYELQATRLNNNTTTTGDDDDDQNKQQLTPTQRKKADLARLSDETDRYATRTLGALLFPFVLLYAVYTLVHDEYSGWYSWFITSASSAVYALGFALMTPQLFLNYKLKSVAHLPWRVLGYKFLNTFIDDLFAFIIRMPTMARISCFRDDIVFIVYLVQRYMYEVDESRPVEGVGGGGSGGGDSVGEGDDKKKK